MKTLVVYYSAQDHTKKIAEEIAQDLQADLFEIVPKNIYTEDDLDWTNDESSCTREHANPELRDIELSSTSVPNWAEYDRIIIGYPIWWGIAAWPVNSFVKSQDFTNKTVIPFCVSHSSGLGESDKELQTDANGGEWQDGYRFFQDASPDDVESWTKSIAE